MLVSCPACAARYRLDPARFAAKRVSIRCPGCQFVFVFPQEIPAITPPPKVLFATANPSLTQALTERCQQGQISCLACNDGVEAIELLGSGLPQTILLDVALTGRYAFDVIQFVRSRPQGDEVRILLLSSSFRRSSFVAKTSDLHGANDSIDGEILSAMAVDEFRQFLFEPKSCQGDRDSLPELASGGEDKPELNPQQWNQASTLAKVIAADIVLRYQDLLEESARTGLLSKALVEGLAKGRQLFEARMGEDFAVNYDFVGAALAACLQGRTNSLSIDED